MTTKSRVRVAAWQYAGLEEEYEPWLERMDLLEKATENLRAAGYRELARRVDEEWSAEHRRLMKELEHLGGVND